MEEDCDGGRGGAVDAYDGPDDVLLLLLEDVAPQGGVHCREHYVVDALRQPSSQALVGVGGDAGGDGSSHEGLNCLRLADARCRGDATFGDDLLLAWRGCF